MYNLLYRYRAIRVKALQPAVTLQRALARVQERFDGGVHLSRLVADI